MLNNTPILHVQTIFYQIINPKYFGNPVKILGYNFIFLGLEAVKQALALGHHVTALVRNPEKMTISDDKLNVVSADIFDSENLKTYFTGHDAVLSCLGFPLQKPKVT